MGSFSDTPAGATLGIKGASQDEEHLLLRLKATKWADSAVRMGVSAGWEAIEMQKSFFSLGPCSKLKKLRHASLNQHKIRSFFRSSAHMNTLTGLRIFFGSFASTIRCYYSFCELKGFPPPGKTGDGSRSDVNFQPRSHLL